MLIIPQFSPLQIQCSPAICRSGMLQLGLLSNTESMRPCEMVPLIFIFVPSICTRVAKLKCTHIHMKAHTVHPLLKEIDSLLVCYLSSSTCPRLLRKVDMKILVQGQTPILFHTSPRKPAQLDLSELSANRCTQSPWSTLCHGVTESTSRHCFPSSR